MILEQCKGVHCVDLGESFQTHIYLQNLASVQPRTSPLKFARSSNAAAERARADGARDGKARHTARGRARHQAMATDLPLHLSEPLRIFPEECITSIQEISEKK